MPLVLTNAPRSSGLGAIRIDRELDLPKLSEDRDSNFTSRIVFKTTIRLQILFAAKAKQD